MTYPLIYNLLFAACCVLAVIGCVFCYCTGVKHGYLTAKGGQPHMPNPAKAVKTAVETDEFNEIMSFSAEKMLSAIKAERAGKGRG